MRSRTTQIDMFRMIGVILLVWTLAHLMSGAFRAFESAAIAVFNAVETAAETSAAELNAARRR